MINSLIKLLYPTRCVVCDDPVRVYEENVCNECYKKLKYITNPVCYRCGKKLFEEEQEYCQDCKERTHMFISGRALYEYHSIEKSLYRYKYQGRKEYGEFFAQEIVYYLGDFIDQINPDGLLPVPMYPKKEKKRGYNQATILAREIGKLKGIKVYENLVKRSKNTKPLKELSKLERVNNLKNSFILDENSVELKTIIIIDDIYTTGSTLDEISSVLLKKYALKIYFITLAIGEGV